MDLEAITRSVSPDSDAEPAALAVQTHEPGAAVADGIGQGVFLRVIALVAVAVALAVGGWLAFSPGDTQGGESSATEAAAGGGPTFESPAVASEAPDTGASAERPVDAAAPTPQPMVLSERTLHAALPALGCVGEASVHVPGPPLVIELPCHVRCVVTVDDDGIPARLVRCRGEDVMMTGEGVELSCTGSRRSSEMRCTAATVFLLGDEEKRVTDTLTLRIGQVAESD